MHKDSSALSPSKKREGSGIGPNSLVKRGQSGTEARQVSWPADILHSLTNAFRGKMSHKVLKIQGKKDIFACITMI
jgi:hypothetical protein